MRIDNNDKIINTDDFGKLQNLMIFLDDKLNILLHDDIFIQYAMKNNSLYRTNFVKQMALDYGKPYLEWNINNSAKYYRIIMTQVRETIKSLAEKFIITNICEQHNWISSKTELPIIHEEINIALKHFVSTKWIKNICKAQAYPTVPTRLNFELDYTSEDNQICKIIEQDSQHVKYTMRMADGTDAILNIPIPDNIRKNTGHFSKPKIRIKFDKDTNEIEGYYADIMYDAAISDDVDVKASSSTTLGVDLGGIKKFSAAAVYEDGTFSKEYLPTKELDILNAKLNKLKAERSALIKKTMTISGMITGLEKRSRDVPDALRVSLARKEKHVKELNGKISKLKTHIACVEARDLVAVAVKEQAGVINLEDLAVLNNDGAQVTARWEFALDRQRLVNVAVLSGVSVICVNPGYTSKTDPFNNSVCVPNSKRVCRTSGGGLDRDYVAALNIGRLKDSKMCCRDADALCYNNGVRFSCGERAVPVRRCSHVLRRASIRM